MEKAIIYARYSSDKQTFQSIEGQVRECELFAQAKGLTIIGKYIDEAWSGKSADKRPDFQRMIKDSQKQLFNYVIVWQLDRFARNRYDSAHYKAILKKNGVKVLSAKENINDDPSGILMETVLEGMAEYYSAELAQKVKRGQYEAFLKGLSAGGKCYGFDLVPADESIPNCRAKKFIVNKAESEIVRKVFEDYASGKTLRSIERWLKNNGIKNRSGQPFVLNTLCHMLKNPKYVGTLTFREHTRKNEIPQIVDTDIFEKAQARIKINKRNPNAYKPPVRFLLSMKTFCGYCKRTMSAECGTSSNNGNVYRYYKCLNKKKFANPCEKTQLAKEKLEYRVVAETLALLEKQEVLETIARQIVEYNDELQVNPKLELYEQQLREVERSLGNMMKALENGIFSNTTQERILKLESDKADLQYRIDGEKMNVPLKLEFLEVLYWLKSFTDGDINDEQYRERIIDAFINKVIIWNDRIFITYNIKGLDGEKMTVDQLIADLDNEKGTLDQKSSTVPDVELPSGFEPLTRSLRMNCSTS